jgi:HSP20 family protein
MTLMKLENPSEGLEKTNNLSMPFEDLFNVFFDGLVSKEYAGFVPSVNIIEDNASYQIEVNAPGFEKEDFNVEVKKGMLTIRGKHSLKKEGNRNFLRKEFNVGTFSRSFNLVGLVNEDNIAGKYENGILRLELPKSESARTKQIQIS